MEFPRQADGSDERAHAWGWFVGWATKGARTIVFARLDQDERHESTPTGLRARDAFMSELPARLATLSTP